MTKTKWIIWICLLTVAYGKAQKSSGRIYENIVPNPGFETWDFPPVGWYYKGDHFTQVMKYWFSPTGTSPDAYGPKVMVPATWKEKGFGRTNAHTGNSYVGITTYGCAGKPHCREYVAVQLNEPLVTGQQYYAEFWVNHLPYSMRTNNLGICFTDKKISNLFEDQLYLQPAVNAKEVVLAKNLAWTKVSARFKAGSEAEYLIIGNFYPDSLTVARTAWKDPLTFGYYYIDDVIIRKEDPILPVPVREDDLTRTRFEAGRTFQLKDIYFEFDKTELLPRSFVELKKLVRILKDNPAMHIVIIGHTDAIGTDEYNQKLSEDRARAVLVYLVQNGIPAQRLDSRGKGSLLPVASNDNDDGRQLNRRVEFLVVQMN
jgi:OOP family OmpA-OmpF porin